MRNPLRYRLWYTTRQKVVTSVLAGALVITSVWYGIGRLTAPEDRSCAKGSNGRRAATSASVSPATATTSGGRS